MPSSILDDALCAQRWSPLIARTSASVSGSPSYTSRKDVTSFVQPAEKSNGKNSSTTFLPRMLETDVDVRVGREREVGRLRPTVGSSAIESLPEMRLYCAQSLTTLAPTVLARPFRHPGAC